MKLLNHFSMQGQVAIVTGAAAGIGRGIAETFAAAGASVFVSDLKLAKAEEAATAIRQAGGQAHAAVCNVTKGERPRATAAYRGRVLRQAHGAGQQRSGGGPKPFDMQIQDFQRTFELNVFSVFRLMQLAAPEIAKACGGAVLNISSMAGDNKNLRMVSYASSNAAQSHLPRNTAFDFGPMNIRVNAIAPGASVSAHAASVPGRHPSRCPRDGVIRVRARWPRCPRR